MKKGLDGKKRKEAMHVNSPDRDLGAPGQKRT